jgi:rare lipoprotein A (peptidoglycan hydrolase)
MRIMAIVILFAWVGLHATSASAQSFEDRWSIIPKAHAEQPPPHKPPPPGPPEQTPTDQSGQQQQSPAAADTTAGLANRPANPSAKRTFYGKASFYSYRKGKTASGSPFDRNMPIAAHRTLPFGTTLRVTNLANNKSVVVTIMDRGPYLRGRVIDLSLDAARSLNIGNRGVVDVRAEVL